MPELSLLSEEKQRARAVWTAGDYPEMGSLIASAGEAVVERAELEGTESVLDIACGDGNATIPAARTGATVTGLDLTPKLLDSGRAKAAEAGVEIEFVEGDAEELPFDDASFDVVLSVFGIMFAPDHPKAAAEAVRVMRPGGRMVLCNWTPEGETGKFFGIFASRMPAPPEGAQPPLAWGSEEHVRELFDGRGVELEFERAAVQFEFDSVDAATELFVTKFGPVVTAKSTLEPEGKWEEALEELRAFFSGHEGDDGKVAYGAEYLIVKGRRPS